MKVKKIEGEEDETVKQVMDIDRHVKTCRNIPDSAALCASDSRRIVRWRPWSGWSASPPSGPTSAGCWMTQSGGLEGPGSKQRQDVRLFRLFHPDFVIIGFVTFPQMKKCQVMEYDG